MSKSKRHIQIMYIGIFVCGLAFVAVCVKQFVSSAFFSSQDRINILFYSDKPIYYSLQKGGEIHYLTTFGADSRTDVPGGYGIYRIGALGKLAYLEKQPDLFRRTFSRITGSMLHYYFYPAGEQVYYGSEEKVTVPSFSSLFLSSSNASFFDRVYIWSQFIGKRSSAFEQVMIKKIEDNGETLLSDKTFQAQYIGFFYSKKLRAENKTVQILYPHSYDSAITVSRIVDGEGMRVVDIDKDRKEQDHACIITDSTSPHFSYTALTISDFFGCRLERSRGSLSDIVIDLGKAEKNWE